MRDGERYPIHPLFHLKVRRGESRGGRERRGEVAASSPKCGEGGRCDEQGKRCKGDELEEVKGSADERRAARGGWKRRETAGTKLFLMSYALALTKCC